jgi:hypothetical protein
MKFEGGWSIGSFRRKVKRGEPDVGQSWFFYRDKGSVLLAHKLILTECGPSKTWVIIQDLPKVLGGNEAGWIPYRDLATRDITNGAWAMLVVLEAMLATMEGQPRVT